MSIRPHARLQVNLENPCTHHDALEFPDGQIVLLTRLCDGQKATVLQMPATQRAAIPAELAEQEISRAPVA